MIHLSPSASIESVAPDKETLNQILQQNQQILEMNRILVDILSAPQLVIKGEYESV